MKHPTHETGRITLAFSTETAKALRLLAMLQGTNPSKVAEDFLIRGGLMLAVKTEMQSTMASDGAGDSDPVIEAPLATPLPLQQDARNLDSTQPRNAKLFAAAQRFPTEDLKTLIEGCKSLPSIESADVPFAATDLAKSVSGQHPVVASAATQEPSLAPLSEASATDDEIPW